MTDRQHDQAMRSQGYLADARRIVIKIGSALLMDEKNQLLDQDWLDSLAADIEGLARRGIQPVVVSSGAIALGRQRLQPRRRQLKLEEKQAAAAIGQVTLARAWQTALERHGLESGQILLSPDDTETRRRHLNARATLTTLMDHRIIPVVNENDTVATTEIRYGDNDRLAARVAQMISADVLVLLSDIDGLYNADPHRNGNACHIPEISSLDETVLAMAGPANADYASGGMVTKLEAARIATAAGCHMVIMNGHADRPLSRLAEGCRCSWFRSSARPHQARRAWIAGGLQPLGRLHLDAGAATAICRGKSLLPAGITAVDGGFERGDLVMLCDPNGQVLGRGLSHYSADDARRIAGHNSREIETILGYRGRDEVVHADDLVLDDRHGEIAT